METLQNASELKIAPQKKGMALLARTLFLNFIYKALMKNFMQLFIGTRFDDNATIEAGKQYIFVANHNSHADTMAIMASLPTHALSNTSPIAAGDYWGKNNFKAHCMKVFINAKLINRVGGSATIEQMNRLLKRGYSIIIYPEGSRGEAGVMQEFKKGVAILLKNNPHIPYIPIHLDGLDKVMPKGDALFIPYSSKVSIGAAQYIHPDGDIESILTKMKTDILSLKELHI